MDLNVSISNASGGGFENLVADSTPVTVTVTDNMTDTTVILSVDPTDALEGETVVFTATLSNPSQGQTIVQLDNGLEITIEDSQLQGSVSYTIPDDPYVTAPSDPTPPDPDPTPSADLSISDLEAAYQGAFIAPRGRYGTGTIAVDPVSQTMFADDWVNGNMPVYQMEIPALVNETSDLSVLPVATELQSPVSMISKTPQTEWGNFDTSFRSDIWGMYHDGEDLFVNGIIYYNASQNGTDTTIRINNPSDLNASAVEGCFKLEHAHAGSRFISPVPPEHQATIGADLLSGAGLGFPIVGRLSKGPSLFGVSSNDLKTAVSGDTISQVEHMNWKDQWLADDYLNYGGACGRHNNDLYVTNSSSTYGFIVGDTYVVLGYSEGFAPSTLSDTQEAVDGYDVLEPGQPCTNPYVGTLTDGVNRNGELFYKNDVADWTDDVGTPGGGYICYNSSAKSPYVWLYRMSDIAAAEGPFDVLPYEYGPISLPFAADKGVGVHADEIAGATLDPSNGMLYICHAYANTTDLYAANYVILGYDLSSLMTTGS